jgi:transposase-like protein
MRVYSIEFRAGVVRRIREGEKISALSKELGIHRKVLYEWARRVEEGGEANLRRPGRPSKSEIRHVAAGAAREIEMLERMVAHQQLIIEFFRQALLRSEDECPRRGANGTGASTTPSVA